MGITLNDFRLEQRAKLPPLVADAIDRYVEDRLPPGRFVTAVLANDLSQAIGRADEHSYARLREIVQYVYNHIPVSAWGSRDKVARWLEVDDE